MGKRILDVTCGSRMFWFDRKHPEAVYLDKRRETHKLKDKSSKGGSRMLVIDPDVIGDFTALPFEAETFPLVVFDPPHLIRNGRSGWMAKKYGKLTDDWKDEIRKGFAECFRVLKADGVLVFKWNENDVRLSEVLPLTPVAPLIGNKGGKGMKTHWLVFMKPGEVTSDDQKKPL
jgi:SAM-dependent methyltransferase